MTDSSAVLLEGPWQHVFVAANGARFHVAVSPADGASSTAPLVVLLHGFPQMWWAWRHQMGPLADAGYRVAAMDLRGAGASDKPPLGYDVPTLARDVAGVIRSLGASSAVVVGHGVGGTIAWAMPALQPSVTRAIGVLGAPHPRRMHTAAVARRVRPAAAGRLAYAQLPWFPERSLMTGDLAVKILQDWGAPGWLDRLDPAERATEVYRAAARIPFAAHSGLETLRWLVRSTPRVDGQRFLAAVREPVAVPVLQVHGQQDRCVPASVAPEENGRPYRFEVVPGAGHFVAEEAPGRTTALLLDWLTELPPLDR